MIVVLLFADNSKSKYFLIGKRSTCFSGMAMYAHHEKEQARQEGYRNLIPAAWAILVRGYLLLL